MPNLRYPALKAGPNIKSEIHSYAGDSSIAPGTLYVFQGAWGSNSMIEAFMLSLCCKHGFYISLRKEKYIAELSSNSHNSSCPGL